MKSFSKTFGLCVMSLAVVPALAGGVSQHAGDSINHSAQAVAHSSAAGAKLVSGAIAVPLMLSGEIGKATGEMGEALWDDANQPIGTPLRVTEDVITVGPSPAEAMAQEGDKK